MKIRKNLKVKTISKHISDQDKSSKPGVWKEDLDLTEILVFLIVLLGASLAMLHCWQHQTEREGSSELSL